ncbi:MAG: ATP synthase F1 subunit gamma [Bacillota bacterium]
MAGKRDIVRRIRAVRSIQQMTKAMKMIAAASLRRSQQKVISARPYARSLQDMLLRLVGTDASLKHPLAQLRPVKRTAYVVITGDRGMAGSYNVNVIRLASTALRESENDTVLIPVGRKGRDFFRRRGHTFPHEIVGLGEEPAFGRARQLAQTLMTMFLNQEVDEVRIIYTEFISALQQRPKDVQLLPITPPQRGEAAGGTQAAGGQVEYIYEPSREAVLSSLLPKFVEVQVYRTILEAKASEHGARMTAMGSATDNATEMIASLTLAYNQARQAAITREISEIVGGAEALGG